MHAAPSLHEDLNRRCDAVEEAYEFMLGFAAQGVGGDAGSQIREFLTRAVGALAGIDQLLDALAAENAAARAFANVVKQDAASARAAFEFVLAQRSVSSQLVDNLNASIHVRTLIADFFLLDEALKVSGQTDNSTLEPR